MAKTVDEIIALFKACREYEVEDFEVEDLKVSFYRSYKDCDKQSAQPQQESSGGTLRMTVFDPPMKHEEEEDQPTEPAGDSLLDLAMHPTTDLMNPPDHEPKT